MPTSKYLKALSILHGALLTGMLLLAGIMIGLMYGFSMAAPKPDLSQPMLIVAVVLCAFGFIASRRIFSQRVTQLNAGDVPVTRKLNDYRAACILRWALQEAPILFCIIAFFITGNTTIILLAGVMLALFFSTRPTVTAITNDCNVSDADLMDDAT